MASIESIVDAGEGKAGNWHVEKDSYHIYTLYHYGTAMLRWDEDWEITGAYPGWGSRSDKVGVNKALRALNSNRTYKELTA